MTYPRIQKGLKRDYIICCGLADDTSIVHMFLEVTTVYSVKTYALCLKHTPDLTKLNLPVVKS